MGVCEWLNANKLTINLNKSNYVIFRPNQKSVSYQLSIKLFDYSVNKLTEIECKEYVDLLLIITYRGNATY